MKNWKKVGEMRWNQSGQDNITDRDCNDWHGNGAWSDRCKAGGISLCVGRNFVYIDQCGYRIARMQWERVIVFFERRDVYTSIYYSWSWC